MNCWEDIALFPNLTTTRFLFSIYSVALTSFVDEAKTCLGRSCIPIGGFGCSRRSLRGTDVPGRVLALGRLIALFDSLLAEFAFSAFFAIETLLDLLLKLLS